MNMNEVTISTVKDGIVNEEKLKNYYLVSKYNHEKIRFI